MQQIVYKQSSPSFSSLQIRQVLQLHYSITPQSLKFRSDQETQTVKVDTQQNCFIFKIFSATHSQSEIDFYVDLLLQAHKIETPVKFPKLILPSCQQKYIKLTNSSSFTFPAILLSYIQGCTLATIMNKLSPAHVSDLSAQLAQVMQKFHKIPVKRIFVNKKWAFASIGQNFAQIVQKSQQTLFLKLIKQTHSKFMSFYKKKKVRKGIIHGDLNPSNIIIDLNSFNSESKIYLIGLIDFGDASYSSKIEDVAIFFSYAILSGLRYNDFQTRYRACLKGWISQYPLEQEEIDMLQILIGQRAVIAVLEWLQDEEERRILDLPFTSLLQWLNSYSEGELKKMTHEEIINGIQE